MQKVSLFVEFQRTSAKTSSFYIKSVSPSTNFKETWNERHGRRRRLMGFTFLIPRNDKQLSHGLLDKYKVLLF
jgi:hypothetical protein